MKPPVKITPEILNLCLEIATHLGQLKAAQRPPASVLLRRQSRVLTIRDSLAIEGNTLTEEQIKAILDGKKVTGPKKDILEVQNAIAVYNGINTLDPQSQKSFLSAHKTMMSGLVPNAGRYRNVNVGVLKGSQIAHMAPKAAMVSVNMAKLFDYIAQDKGTHPLIKASVVHYEIEFIHPFEDGNGRMGRLWQNLILRNFDRIFDVIPVETIVRQRQQEYYDALESSDKKGHSTPFVLFSLAAIKSALETFAAEFKPGPIAPQDRLELAREHFGQRFFSRKDFIIIFKSISTATASRDLLLGMQSGMLQKKGVLAQTRYQFTK